jgi:muramoyltetrapeptide carboxypeptidase
VATRPPMLWKGDTIGIVTLGSPLDPGEIKERIAFLELLGYRVILGDYVYASNGYLSGTDEQRAADLMSMFQNPNVKAILPTRGGVGVEGILPYLNYCTIEKNPKIISGYSDITVLLNVLYQFSHLITFHSLLLLDFREGTPPYNFEQFFAATSTPDATRQIVNPPEMSAVSKIPGNVTGSLVGGNLTYFVGSLGTPYEINTRGKILFLEEVHEPINTVYRYLNQLKVAGKFRDCNGIILGECSECENAYQKSYEDLILEFILPLGKPLMTNVATGHGKYKAALPIGAQVNLNTIANTLTVLEPTVSRDQRYYC